MELINEKVERIYVTHSEKTVIVHANPTFSQMVAFTQNSKYKVVRWIYTTHDKTLRVWQAQDAIHSDIYVEVRRDDVLSGYFFYLGEEPIYVHYTSTLQGNPGKYLLMNTGNKTLDKMRDECSFMPMEKARSYSREIW